jgi:tetratricopeptide (TPR) repeat protein
MPERALEQIAAAEKASSDEAWPDAVERWRSLAEQNPVNGRFWSELARASYEGADFAGAIEAAFHALELRAGSPAETALLIARSHARLCESDPALDWLERAFELGWRKAEEVRNDDVFTRFSDDERFQSLTGLADYGSLSRDEGWRFDLRFLAREIRRLAFDPFRLQTESEFETAIEEIEASIPNLTDAQVLVAFNRLLVPLGDGHAYVFPSSSPGHEALKRTLPLQFYLFQEGLFVIGAVAEHADLLGGQIAAIDGTPIEAIIAAVEPTICRDNDQWPNEILPFRLRETPMLHAMGLLHDARGATLTVVDLAGSTRNARVDSDFTFPNTPIGRNFPFPDDWSYLAGILPQPKPLYLRDLRSPFWFEHLSEIETVYLQFNSVRDGDDETFQAFTERLFTFIDERAIRRLIIDMRWNKGGNTTLEWPFVHNLVARPAIDRKGSLFAIIGRRVFSAAQNFATYLDLHTNVTFVGEPTGSCPTFIGENIEFTLPWSRCLANVSDLLWQSSWPEDHRTWIAPEIYVPPTFAAFRENRDPALEAILESMERPLT